MTFSFTYPSAKDFNDLIVALSKATDSITINVTDEGINGRYVEPDTKSMMVILNVPKTFFSSYEIEKPLSLELNLASLRKVLSKAKSRTASVEVSETDSGMRITVKDNKLGTKSNIYVSSKKGEVNDGGEPKVSPTVKMSLDSRVLELVVGDSSIIGDEVLIKGEGEEVTFSTSERGKEYTATMRKDKPLKYIEVADSAESKFRAELLKEAVSITSNFSNVDVELGTNIPLKMRGEADAGGQVTVWIAPVI
ncbi:hypothetical protein [Sulfuracidifex tepidarius]|uniref:DNA polymerase sliding clamp n=1 Tax=Sulfuracidifex tepidarius TaxID=1294262 RepID=A0A510E358_9CREN|nr:hypothetical protein [Sulfuracidifex tepidarius]BBG24185.1 DNA polymerase sliding clamp 2 [Sulfuracidifex tepidarius]BBG26942.1 DNA polymerase sliding clamp 2 [Sulfuracidifex tepidarius]